MPTSEWLGGLLGCGQSPLNTYDEEQLRCPTQQAPAADDEIEQLVLELHEIEVRRLRSQWREP